MFCFYESCIKQYISKDMFGKGAFVFLSCISKLVKKMGSEVNRFSLKYLEKNISIAF